jgi:branched-chain amino acid transport system substrate-binding protein
VAYINAELGGIGGRPLELVPCFVESESDAAGCASRLGDDPTIPIVMTGALQVGGSQLYDGLADRKPVLISSGLTSVDFLTTHAHTYTVGGAGVVAGLSHFIATSLPQAPKKVAVVHLSTPAGTTAVSLFVEPLFTEHNINAVYVPVSDAATRADVTDALTNAGAQDADVVFAIVNLPNCINLYDSLAELAIAPTVVSVGTCGSTPIAQHLASLGLTDAAPDAWYFGSNGYNQHIPNTDAGVDTYNAKIQQYGTPEPGSDSIDATGLASLTFATTLTIAKLMNHLGERATDQSALAAAVVGFTGPMMFQVGPIACGATTVLGVSFPAVCASQMGVQQYIDGTWVPVADGNNGRSIDITAL